MRLVNSALTSKNRLLEENTTSMGSGYKHTNMISHRGKVIAFALNDKMQIVYNVLNLSSAAGSSEKKKATNDSKNWSNVPKILAFPNEISEIGHAVFGHTDLKQVNKDNELVEDGDESSADAFKSSTARLTAEKPFLVLSDERYIYLFRQPTEDLNLLARDISPVLGDDGQPVIKGGYPVMSDTTPLVQNGAVLMDRFVLSGETLKLCRELRYQRSGDKTNPKSAKDTLSGQDLNGKPFYEPTRQLPFVSDIIDDGFTITLLPDGLEEGDGKRWQIFYVDKATRKLCSINIKYDVEVVFDFRDQASAIEQFLAEKKLSHIEIFRTIKTKLDGGQPVNVIVSDLINEQASLKGEDKDYLDEVVVFCQNGLLIDKTEFHDQTGVANIDAVTGMSACMYYQKTGEDKEKKKQKACVMLALGANMQGKNAIAILSYDLAKGGILTNISKDQVNLSSIDLCSKSKLEVEQKLTGFVQKIAASKKKLAALLRARKGLLEQRKTALKARKFPQGCNVVDKMLDPIWDRHSIYYDDDPKRLAADITQSAETIKQYQAALQAIEPSHILRGHKDFSQPIGAAKVACNFAFGATVTFHGPAYALGMIESDYVGSSIRQSMVRHYKERYLRVTHSDSDTLRALIDAERYMQAKLTEISDEWINLKKLQQKWLEANQEFHSGLRPAGLDLISGDANGLITQGGILSMGDKEASCPFLYDDPLGFVNLYFIQGTARPSVLYFDPSLQKSEVPKNQHAIQFAPNTDLSFNVTISATANDNNTVSLDVTNTKDTRQPVESWRHLPKHTGTISNILNGDDEVAFGSLYKPYVAGEDFLVLKVKYTHELLSLPDKFADQLTNDGADRALPAYLKNNPILSVGGHRFGLNTDEDITISKGCYTSEELDDLSKQICDVFDQSVENEAPIEQIKMNAEVVDSIRQQIQENNEQWCTIILPVKTSTMHTGSIDIDCGVSSTYNYKDNFTFSLDQITHGVEKDFAGQRSFLFQAKDLGGGIETLKPFSYESGTLLGMWHPTQASMCLEFNHSAAVGASSSFGHLQLAGSDKLDLCAPTNKGLSLEVWVKPKPLDSDIEKYSNREKMRTLVYFNNKDGDIQSRYSLSLQEKTDKDLTCIAKIDGKKLTSTDTISFNEWHHLAFICHKYWSVKLAQTPIPCGKDIALDFDDEYSIEVFIQPETTTCELLSKGNEYRLALRNGTVIWEVAGVDMLHDVQNTLKVGTEPTKITIFRTRHKPSDEKMKLLNKQELPGNKAQDKWYNKKGKNSKIDVDALVQDMEGKEGSLLTKLQTASNDNDEYKAKSHQVQNDKYYYTLAVRSGGKSQAWAKKDPVESNTIESPEELKLGSTSFSGTFLSVRLWNRVLNDDEVKEYHISEDQASLVSWWSFNEGMESKVVYDHSGTSHGRLPSRGATWVESPDDSLVKYELYIDGKPIDYTEEDDDEIHTAAAGDAKQFSIAAYKSNAGACRLYYGQLDEVRVWGKPRTLEQITDNCFGVLKGEREDLIAYYKFEFQPYDNVTQPGIHDSGNNGMNLVVNGTVYHRPENVGSEVVKQVLSTAPISTEIPIIHQAMSEIVYDPMAVSGAYGAVEYGDIQKDEEGVINGVLKRAYSIIDDAKEWRLTTGYKVGNLKSQWYSQTQYDPQVIGYVEGAPPLPLENLPDPKDLNIFDMRETLLENYVNFEQVDEVQYTYDTSKEKGYQTAFESSSDIGADISTLIAPFGFGIELEAQVTAKANSNWQHNHKQSQSLNSGAGLNIDKTMSARAACYETENGEFRLSNMGFALVKSKTADVYLLKMEHNDELVSIYYEPSKDIPEDNNIIPFPIDPLYTKQGCLDGKTGEHADTHYPNAQLAYGEYSYFKPKEAYKLKKNIERKQKYLQTYYEDVFDEQQVSGHFQLAAGLTGGMQALGAIPMSGGVVTSLMNQTLGQVATNIAYRNMHLKDDLVKVASTRNICNQYIWTLDGGLYQEETQTIAMQQETYSGDNDLDLGGGAGYGLSIKAAAESTSSFLFKSSSNLSVTRSKTKDSTQTFNVNVGLQLPLQPSFEYGGLSSRTLVKSKVKPGTVDAYRFMSFYLEPSSKNFSKLFDEVIDQKWLAESPHPNAIALRQAMGKAEAKKPCWRIFHRVTFVSRILPEFKKKASGTVEEAMDQLGIVSNYMLIKSFEPYLAGIKNDDALRSKIDRVIETKFPTLKKHESAVKGYLSEYFDVMSQSTGINANVAALADAPTLKQLHLGASRDQQTLTPVGQPAQTDGISPSGGTPLQSIVADAGLAPIQDQVPVSDIVGSSPGPAVTMDPVVSDAINNPLTGTFSVADEVLTIPTAACDWVDFSMSHNGLHAAVIVDMDGTRTDSKIGLLTNGGRGFKLLSNATFQSSCKIWISEDGATLIVASEKGMHISKTAGQSWQDKLASDSGIFYFSFSVSPRGDSAIGVGDNGKMYIHKQTESNLIEHKLSEDMMAAAISENGQKMVAGGEKGAIYISSNHGVDWSLFSRLPGKVKAIGMLDNGKIIAAISRPAKDGTLGAIAEIYEIVPNGQAKVLQTYTHESDDDCYIAISKTQKTIAVCVSALALNKSHIWIVNAEGGKHVTTHQTTMDKLAVSDLGNYIACGGYEECLISSDYGRNWGSLEESMATVEGIGLSYDGQKIIVCQDWGKVLLSDDGGRSFVSNWKAGDAYPPHNN